MQNRDNPTNQFWTRVQTRRVGGLHSPGRRSTLKWFRAGKSQGRLSGFIVTWDVDSHDAALCRRLQRFVYGFSVIRNGRLYRYPGFVETDGVRYLGQSVLMVRRDLLSRLVEGLGQIGVDFDLDQGSIG